MRKALRQMVLALATKGSGSQVFLGARWVRRLLKAAPPSRRWYIALWLLSLSPHYFYPEPGGSRSARWMERLRSEFRRLRRSRAHIAEKVVAGYIGPGMTVLDFGCGPGFLSVALSDQAAEVIACDISDGVLACAEVVNPAPNVHYTLVPPSGPLPLSQESVDVICSFAVLQHVAEDDLRVLLHEFHRVLRRDGLALWHFPVDKDDWRSEEAWRADTSLRGRLRLKYGLNCFGRSRADVLGAIETAGFTRPDVIRLGTFGDLHDVDLEDQELFVCRKAVI